MSRREEILSAVGEAAELVEEFPTKSRTSFDLISVIETLDIPVIFRPLDSLLGAAVTINDQRGILINSQRIRQLQRFTLAHELGHVLLQHDTRVDEEVGFSHRSVTSSKRPTKEIAADTFASELLAPRNLLRQNILRQNWDRDDLREPEIIYQLSLRIGLSFPATSWALVEHDLLSQDRANELTERGDVVKDAKNSFIPDSIAREKDPWADVWLITDSDSGTELETHEDDIFVFQLDERSSSGYVWDISDTASDIEIIETEVVLGEEYGSTSKSKTYLEFENLGNHSITFEHKRPWNNDIIQDFNITIDNRGKEDDGFPRRIRQAALTG